MKSHTEWYRGAQSQYDSLAGLVATTLRSMLKTSLIDFVDVTCRAKSLESFTEKIQRKNYANPAREMMDLAGVRVIVFVERDIKRVEELIQHSFKVHPADSSDKTTTLGEDRFGYRSVHFVCDIGEGRASLPEFKPFANMQFEIQVRTVLQHAWAEIEHDRSYKLGGTLPSQLKRRLHLIAGLLELADREFSSLTEEIEKYVLDVEEKAQTGQLAKVEVNSASVDQLLRHKFSTVDHSKIRFDAVEDEILDELRAFGVTALDKLDGLLNNEVVNTFSGRHNTTWGILRHAMMFQDIDRYFTSAWQGHWQAFVTGVGFEALRRKYGGEKIAEVLAERNIDLFNSDID